MKPPLLSVVIANYNYDKYLEDAILSVITQDEFEKAELIVVDGGSTDESVRIIKKYESSIAWWCTEKDSGQSEAFNKGFLHSTGEFLTWLNADDVLLHGAFHRFFAEVERHPEQEWFVGGCCYVTQELRVFRCIPARPFSHLRASMAEIQVYGPSSFFSRRLFDSVGGRVDETFHYLMDIELWNRLYHVGRVMYRRLPGYFWGFRFQPDSKTTGYQCGQRDGKIIEEDVPPVVLRMRAERALIKRDYSTRDDSAILMYATVSPLSKIRGWVDTIRLQGKIVETFKRS